MLYAFSALLLAGYVISTAGNLNPDDERFWMAFTLVIHAVAQLIYTLKTRPLLDLPPYKEMDTLDDFMAQPMNVDSRVLENSGFIKFLGVLSVIGCVISIVSSAFMFFYILNTIFSPWNDLEEISLVFISLAALLFGIPALIYDMRTFAIKRIRPGAGS